MSNKTKLIDRLDRQELLREFGAVNIVLDEGMTVRLDVIDKIIEMAGGYICLGYEEQFVDNYFKGFNFEENRLTKEYMIEELKLSNKLIHETVIKELDGMYKLDKELLDKSVSKYMS